MQIFRVTVKAIILSNFSYFVSSRNQRIQKQNKHFEISLSKLQNVNRIYVITNQKRNKIKSVYYTKKIINRKLSRWKSKQFWVK